MTVATSENLRQLARVFLQLGAFGFGGPAAHIALMEEEVVRRRNWMSSEAFLDLVGATNLIPGPNSTELAIHIGYLRGGWSGLLVSGVCFILPAVAITTGFAWIYQQFGTLPQIAPLFAGIQPIVLGIIALAVWRLGQKALKNRQLWWIAAGVLGAGLWGIDPVLAMLLGGILGAILLKLKPPSLPPIAAVAPLVATPIAQLSPTGLVASPNLWHLGLFFLKVGSILYGGGYVLVAFLQDELVNQFGWLTQQQLLDAIAVGQFTPGPILSTATFIGYLIADFPGAIVSTVCIFLPSFLFVILLNPWIPKLRQFTYTAVFLDAINASAVALMAAVTLQLGQTLWGQPGGWLKLAIAVIAFAIVWRWRVNPAYLVLLGGAIGWLFGSIGLI
jgi:chromate transporter